MEQATRFEVNRFEINLCKKAEINFEEFEEVADQLHIRFYTIITLSECRNGLISRLPNRMQGLIVGVGIRRYLRCVVGIC